MTILISKRKSESGSSTFFCVTQNTIYLVDVIPMLILYAGKVLKPMLNVFDLKTSDPIWSTLRATGIQTEV